MRPMRAVLRAGAPRLPWMHSWISAHSVSDNTDNGTSSAPQAADCGSSQAGSRTNCNSCVAVRARTSRRLCKGMVGAARGDAAGGGAQG